METTQPGLAVTSIHNHLHIWSYQDAEERDKAAREYATAGFARTIETCDVQKLAWANPNQQHIQTGCKTFDKQTNCLSTGNVIANTMFGAFIRPRMELRCNNFEFAYADLQRNDLKIFRDAFKAHRVIRYIENLPHAEHHMLLLSVIFHKVKVEGESHRVIHGAVLTDTYLREVRRFDRNDFGLDLRSRSSKIMDVVAPHLTDQIALNRVPYQLH